MTTTIGHPSLRGRADHRARTSRRPVALIPGISTMAFWLLAAIVTVLCMIGLVMVMSASSVEAVRDDAQPWALLVKQGMWMVGGLLVMAATFLFSPDLWKPLVRVALFASYGLLVAVLFVGSTRNGATRWIDFGPMQLQPSEIAKFSLLLFVAKLLDDRQDEVTDWHRCLIPVILHLGIVAGLVMKQPNLGTTIIIAVMVLVMLAVGGVPLGPLSAVGLAGATVAAAFVAFTPFRRTRFLRFLNPWGDPYGSGLQNVQSLVGIANGGIFGRGLGQSTAKWGFLPYAHTDFIFAVIGEEFGIVGALFVVLLFFGFVLTGAWIALRARTRYQMLIATGITVWIGVQAFMNIGAVIGLMPITGVPLPFISYGGTSLMINMAAIGMLLNIARHPSDAQPPVSLRRRRPAARGIA